MNPLDSHVDPDTNNIKGLKMPDVTLCTAKDCADSKRCRRHTDSGTKPDSDCQAWSDFTPNKDRACQAYWPAPHQHIKDDQ